MSEFLFILLILVSLIGLNYFFLIFTFTLGWFKVKEFNNSSILDVFQTKISIIIPFRNEENCILNCLNSIIQQDFPSQLFEIILIDDHSEDASLEIVRNFAQRHINYKIKIIELAILNIAGGSKKEAIKEGIAFAEGELIITTDADCYAKNNWLKSIVSYYEIYKPNVIIAPVCFFETDSIFKRMQYLEFLSLQSIGLSSVGMSRPILANGANLAYRKEIFTAINGFKGHEHIASGDDIFLIHQINSIFPNTIHYLKSFDALVYTKPQRNYIDFINQRVRWASKSKFYKDNFAKYVSLSVLMFNVSLFILLLLSIFNLKMFILFVVLFITKLFVDFPLLSYIVGFVKAKKLLNLFVLLSFFYIIYVCFVSCFVIWGKYYWKGRKINC